MSSYMSGVKNIICPTAIRFKEKIIVFGEQFVSILVISDFPVAVGNAWLANITNQPDIISSIHINPTSADELVEQLQHDLRNIKCDYKNIKNELEKYQIEQQISNARAVLNKIIIEKQKVYTTTIVLRVIANTKEQLYIKVKNLQVDLASYAMRARVLVYRQDNGLKAVAPYAMLSSDLKTEFGTKMLSETIAAAFPFTATGINDGKGIVLGRDSNGGLSLVDMWNKDRANSNWLVLGKSGVGKTTAVQKILLNNYAHGYKVIVIDPEQEYKKLCECVNGSYICLGSNVIINPLEIKKSPLSKGNNSNAYIDHINTVRTFFNLYFKGLTSQQNALLEESLNQLYKNYRLNQSTNYSKISPSMWPTLSNLYDLIKEKNNALLATLMKKLAMGVDAKLYNGFTNVKNDSNFIVFNTFALQSNSIENRRALLFNILTWVWNEIIKSDKRIVLAIDEAYLLVDKEIPQALQFLRNTAKRIRKYNGSLITISQNINDFLDSQVAQFGQAVVDNPTYKLVMAQGENDLNILTKLLQLKDAAKEILSSGTRGDALLIAGAKRVLTRLEYTDFEKELLLNES